MPFLYKDYTDLIVKTYKHQRNAGQLSRLLMHPTTANIKQACLNVYLERIKNGEEEKNTLESFFGVPPAGRNLEHVIGRCSPDKFRPLQNLIKGEIKNPNLINVELLAWLIDFMPRPWMHAQRVFNTSEVGEPSGRIEDGIDSQTQPDPASINVTGMTTVPLSENILQSNGEVSIENVATTGREVNNNQPTNNPNIHLLNHRLKKAAVISLIMAILLGGIYIIWQREGSRQSPAGNTDIGCMYWADDHYEQVLCNQGQEGRLIVPLNEEKMKNFKRIMREDTITEKSIGKVYYIKINKTIEYYTAAGNHPVETTRSLKKLSPYMFDKYLDKKEMANKN